MTFQQLYLPENASKKDFFLIYFLFPGGRLLRRPQGVLRCGGRLLPPLLHPGALPQEARREEDPPPRLRAGDVPLAHLHGDVLLLPELGG